MQHNYNFRARKAIHKEFFDSYKDRPVTAEQIQDLWGFLAVVRITPNKLAEIINTGVVEEWLLQDIYDALKIKDIA